MKKIVAVVLFGSLLLASFFGCKRDEFDQSSIHTGETCEVELSFGFNPIVTPPPTRSITDRSSGLDATIGGDTLYLPTPADTLATIGSEEACETTRAILTNEQEQTINNLCLFQFDGTGNGAKLIYKHYFVSTDIIAGKIRPELFVANGQTLYAVCNMGDITAGQTINSSTLSTFKAYTLSYPTEASVITGTNLPWTGSYAGNIGGSANIQLPLTMAVAKVSLTFNFDAILSGTTVKSVQLKNVANKGAISVTTPYPAADAANFVDYAMLTTYTAGQTLTWYIPQNLQGGVVVPP
jgi:hypothetical protein